MEVLTLGEWAVRNGCGHQKRVGGGGDSASVPDPPWRGLSAAQVLTLVLLKGFTSTACFLGHSLEPAAASSPSSLLLTDSVVDVTLPFLSPLSWLCLRRKAVRDILYLPSLRDVQHPRCESSGLQFLSPSKGAGPVLMSPLFLKQQKCPGQGHVLKPGPDPCLPARRL